MGKFDNYINVTAPLHSATIKGKLGNANEIFLEGDTKNIENEIKEINSRHENLNKKHDALNSKYESLSKTVQGIAATGGASTAANVTYNNDNSGLNAENAQDAIDELSSIGHFAKRGGVVNISTNYNTNHIAEVLTLSQAIAKVPSKDRVLGFTMTFLSSDGWKNYQFTGGSIDDWGNIDKWNKMLSNLDISTSLFDMRGEVPSRELLEQVVTNNTLPLNPLTPSSTGEGYVLPSTEEIKYGAFGNHNIYTIKKNVPFSIEYNKLSDSNYGFIITDLNGNILNSWRNSDFPLGKSLPAYSDDLILYASVVAGLQVYTGYGLLRTELDKIPNNVENIYRNSILKDISVFGKKFVSGTKIEPLKAGLIQVRHTINGIVYTTPDSSIGTIYSIPASDTTFKRYIYCKDLYVDNLSTSFVNVLLLDKDDNILLAGQAISKMIFVPSRYKCLILARANSKECFADCNVAEELDTIDTRIEELDTRIEEDTSIDSHFRVTVKSTGDYIIFNSNVGSKVSFGTFGNHSVYDILPDVVYTIRVTYPNGGAYQYAITDANGIVLQLVRSDELNFVDNIATFTFKKFNNAAKLYCSYSPDVFGIEHIKIKDYLQSFYDKVPVSLEGNRHDGYIKSNKVGSEISFDTFGSSMEYNIEPNVSYSLDYVEYGNSGGTYCYAITDINNIIIEAVQSHGPNKRWNHVFGKYDNAAKLFVSINGTYSLSIATSTDLKDKVNSIEDKVNSIEDKGPLSYIATLNFSCDGDSMTKSWNNPMNKLLGFNTVNSNAMGNAKACDRTSATSGTTYYPQWAPNVRESFIDYFGLSDPNYTEGGDSKYVSGTKEFDQATANNCLYGHLGRFIYKVSKGDYPIPDVFVLNLMGVNDTWTTSDITNIIGDFEDVISGSYEKENIRTSILGALRWYITIFRKEFPNCKLFYKTSSQQAKDSHTYFYKVYEPVVKLMRYLSVPVIDSYAEIGIMADLESKNNPSNNQWTSDGTHPTSAGYEMDGKFVATKIYNWFSLK